MSILKHLKLGTKLIIFLGTILVLLVLSTLFAYFGLTQNSNDFHQFGKITNEEVLAGRIQSNLLESQMAFKNFIELEDNSQQQVFEDRFAKMQTFIDDLKSTTGDKDRAKSVDTISLKANEYKDGFNKVVEYKAKRDTIYNSMSIMGTEMEQNLSKIMQSASDDQDVEAVYGAGNAERNLLLLRLSVMKYLENDDQKSIDLTKTQFSELDKSIDIYGKSSSSAKNKELLDLIIKDKTDYFNSFNEITSVVESTKSIVESLDVIGPEISGTAEEIKASIIKEQDSYGPKVQKSNNNSIYGMLLLSLLAISLVVLISIGILKMVVVPVKTVTNTFKDISEGEADLRVRLKVGSSDELGDMAIYFNKFMEKLQVIMTQIKNQTWVKTGQTELNEKIRGGQDLRALGNMIITYMAKYLNVQIGAIYLLTEDDNTLKMMGSYAYSRRKNLSDEIKVGEGLVGQSALEKQTIVISNVPDDYIKVQSGTFESVPRNIIVSPCIFNDKVKCVLELGSLQEITDLQQEFIEQIAESIAIAIHFTEARSKMKTLLDKTLKQSQELQAQQEELRQSNKELEEQARALKESEARLQAQQEELRQSNEELEEQARALKESEASLNAQQEELRVINEELEERTKSLEMQKNNISIKNKHLESAQKEIEDKAKALQVASKYKSEFLANVSHELRTPLNSILVLSQLLANKTDHSPLTDKQLEFAKTIYSSGTDLLKLINDVLDLSKIEAGKMNVNYENMSIEEFLDYVERSFRQIALDKGLEFKINLDEQLPESISTDIQRVQQIINNLVSNAFKFTKEGGVTINVSRPSQNDFPQLDMDYAKSICLAISDTGIGIPAEKQSFIFEAFRQSDGTTSREYGGTGLGLSISKELAQLLGGTIDLKSEEGKGSTFALILPEELVIPKAFEQAAATLQEKSNEAIDIAKIKEGAKSEVHSNENGSIINLSDKMLLIIDDDQNFSGILADLAHEKGFTCLTSNDGETGIQLAIKHKPKAILLDIGLPGISGWEVIEELKNHIETRNIPVHIISGHESFITDKSEKGIVGYLRKPVSVDKINDMFKRLEGLEEKSLKKLLIIASDDFQKTAIAEIIGKKDIVVSTVDTGQEAYDLLKTERFDCIIFDTKLRDMSGYELLAKLREEKDQVPIIIYTDKDFITDDEGPLQDYGESIIIKGSRSMERLVAEASLFLHGVNSKITDKKHKVTKKYQEKEASLKDKKVLIVDDDMRNVFALTSALEEKNMIVIIGKNGREGIDKLHQNQDIDLILMDIMMPEMDGYSAMKEIRKEEKFRKIPIIALTAKAMKEDKNKCIEAGANDYLTKPIELDKLISLLRVWLYK